MLKLKKPPKYKLHFYLNKLGFFSWAASHKKLNIGDSFCTPEFLAHLLKTQKLNV
jgi:hypothetical protein